MKNSVSISGIEVKKIYYSASEAKITHGAFELTNTSEHSVELSISSLLCRVEDQKIAIPQFFVYKLLDYDELNPAEIQLAAQETLSLEISFAQIPATTYLNQEIMIEATFQQGNHFQEARSPYLLTIRTAK
ncbi:MAG: hypothetical protein HC880_10890 [Bacteroidia bacterium]|nr:hypothetical protein [Bacteroidia bacterium]